MEYKNFAVTLHVEKLSYSISILLQHYIE